MAKDQPQDTMDLLKAMQDDKLSAVKRLIIDIEQMIVERKELSKKTLSILDKTGLELDNTIMNLPAGSHLEAHMAPQTIQAISELRKKKVELEEAKVNEMVNCWRDIAELKKELRESVREFSEEESTQDTLRKILED